MVSLVATPQRYCTHDTREQGFPVPPIRSDTDRRLWLEKMNLKLSVSGEVFFKFSFDSINVRRGYILRWDDWMGTLGFSAVIIGASFPRLANASSGTYPRGRAPS